MSKEKKIIIKAILLAIKDGDFKSAWKIIKDPKSAYHFLEQMEEISKQLLK